MVCTQSQLIVPDLGIMRVSMPVIIPRVSKDNVVTFRKECLTLIKDREDKTGELIGVAASLCAVTARLLQGLVIP